MYAQELPERRVLAEGPLPEGEAGTVATLRLMAELAQGGARTPNVRSLVDRLAMGGRPELPRRIREWLAGAVHFRHDPPDAEEITAPARLILEAHHGTAGGDCDDIATLGAALALAAGFPARFVTVATAHGAPWSHVYAELRADDGTWRELDTSREIQGIPPGWRAPRVKSWPTMLPEGV